MSWSPWITCTKAFVTVKTGTPFANSCQYILMEYCLGQNSTCYSMKSFKTSFDRMLEMKSRSFFPAGIKIEGLRPTCSRLGMTLKIKLLRRFPTPVTIGLMMTFRCQLAPWRCFRRFIRKIWMTYTSHLPRVVRTKSSVTLTRRRYIQTKTSSTSMTPKSITLNAATGSCASNVINSRA